MLTPRSRLSALRLPLLALGCRLPSGDHESHFLDHPIVGFRRLTFGGEIVADNRELAA